MLQIISYCLYQQSYDVERYLFVRGCLHDTGRLLSRSEFTPVPCGSAFVYMILPENVIPARLHPVSVPEREFHSRAKSCISVM